MPDPRLEEKVRGTSADFLRFTSPVVTPFPENNLVMRAGFRRADVAPWSCFRIGIPTRLSYNSLCRMLNWMGIAVLRLSMPYHDIRRPAEIDRADYAVSANIGRTLDSVRQGVIDVRCCLDWLESQGYDRSESSGRAWDRATRSSPPRMIRAFKSRPSITHRPILPMSSGTGKARVTFARGSNPQSI